MYRFRRFLFVLLSVLFIIAVIAAVLGFITVRRSFPQTDGVIHLPSLDAPVEIYRDSYGIPHIYASTPHDLFMAQGFIHAQDRFWQMEFWRRIGSGRLSEILGSSTLDQDIFIRTVGWHRTAAQELEQLLPEEQAILEAYAEGVNTYLTLNQGRLGLEFTILGLTGVKFDPEPWTPLNTITWAKVMAWDLSGNMDAELARANIAARLGTPVVSTLLPPYPDEHPVIVPHPLSSATIDALPDEALDFHPIGARNGIGSNNWVISGNRTETGMPILANDPHLGIQMPSIWYEIGLHCDPVGPECPYNLVGFSFASSPGVIIGHNDRIAWGVTNLGPDVQDLFIERVNPENPNQYMYLGSWEDMEIVREEIVIEGEEEPYVVNVRMTRHGPIINDIVGGTEETWSFGWQPLAFSWTALEPGTMMRSVLMLNRAQNWDQFREALRYWDVPSQNFVYADIDGNIGYQAPGRIPIRDSGDGSMPVPGWTGEYEWSSYIPFERLPSAFNPEEGYIVTANNAVVGKDYPYLLSLDWDPGFRASRIVELIEADDAISISDVQTIQGDDFAAYAQNVLPTLLELTPNDARLKEALDQLRKWDGHAQRDSAGAAIYESMRIQAIDHVFGDELGEQLLDRIRGDLTVTLIRLLPDPSSPWFDDIDTTEIETRDDILLRTLEASVDELTQKLGRNISKWRWGKLHTATFENQSLGQSGIGPIEAIFNRGPVPVDGASQTVNNNGYDMGDPYHVSFLPSMRMVVDLQEFTRSQAVHTTGQSGHPFHPHYTDMIEPWSNILYHPMLWVRQDVVAAAEAHLTLTPGGG